MTYIITKSSRNASAGYTGPSCAKAGVEPGQEYASRIEAQQDAEGQSTAELVMSRQHAASSAVGVLDRLNAVNRVGFRVVKQR